MSGLAYKTRGGSTPQGKPRVYFCCHPDDFKTFFESISDEILKLQNCAIWYKTGREGMTDDLLSDLKQMQLFVMPVTSRLLYTENEALSVEFRFAIEQHIPVLPLMQENGLNELFNQACGDLQFLEKNNTDATVISYEEKLKKYLGSVLIGDELAEKIRAAFDAYVFLSYRKKDRKYAQELMRLIHKNDFCRNIALWYDEFLTPGENFNDAIKEALQKSNLFVLTVTPNLINEINYVMTTEYPMAKENGKPILPAELVPTDRKDLTEKYAGIPICLDAHNEAELSRALLDSLENIATRENDTPEHDFFIGLAYLGGVDVEVDHARALELITSAANAKLPEAMEKLVSMYRMGEGVERDYNKAVAWQRRLVDYYRDCYTADDCEDNARKLFSAQLALGHQLDAQHLWGEAKAIYGHMRELCLEADKKYDFRRNLAINCYELGRIAFIYRAPERARDFCEQFRAHAEAIAKETGTPQARRDLAISYDSLGNIARDQGNLDEAQAFYRKSLDLKETIAKEVGTPQARCDLAISYDRLGNVARDRGNLDEARAFYWKSLNLKEVIAKEAGTPQARRSLAISYDNLGNIAGSTDDLENAWVFYRKSLDLKEAIAKEVGTLQAHRDLAIAYENLSSIAQKEEKPAEADEYDKKSLNLRNSIVKEEQAIQARYQLSQKYDELGNIAKASGLSQEKAFHGKSLDLDKVIAREMTFIKKMLMKNDYRDFSANYRKLGDFELFDENPSSAKAFYDQALVFAEIFEQEGGRRADLELSVSYIKLGDCARAEQKWTAAKELYRKALMFAMVYREKTASKKVCFDLMRAYGRLGDVAIIEENWPEAKEYCEQSLALAQDAVKEIDGKAVYTNLRTIYRQLESIAQAMGDPDAEKMFRRKYQETDEIMKKRWPW